MPRQKLQPGSQQTPQHLAAHQPSAQSQPLLSTPVPSSPDGAASTQTTWTQFTLPPEVAAANEILLEMKTKLGSLGATFDSMGAQTAQMALLGSELEITQHLNSLRSHIKDQDQKQEDGIAEIQELLKDLMEVQMMKYLQQQVEADIEIQIDELVREQVAKYLEKYIPKALQDELADRKRELEEVQRALHNSESRRANAELRSSDPEGCLHTIYRPNGEISTLFPRTLRNLFALDAESSRQLLLEYEQPDVSDSRERNLNRFIQFCGVSYQVVPTNRLDHEDDVTYRSPTAVKHEYGTFRFGMIKGAVPGGS